MKTNYLILIAFLLALTFSQVSSQSDSNRVYCEPQDENVDPSEVMCTMEYNPVCAFQNGSDSNGTTAGNPCQACGQLGFDYYTLGACPGDGDGETENGEGEGNNEEEPLIVYCQLPDLSATEIACTDQYEPVCAYHFDDSSDGKTIGNACTACLQQGYDYYIKGECSDEGNPGEEEESGEGDNGEGTDHIIQCPVLNLTATDVACTLQYDPVCAYHANDTNLTNGVTVGNACEACQQQGYAFYTQGACEGSGNEEEIILNEELYPNGGVAVVCELPNLSATDILCLDIYEPVCAYYFNDTNEEHGVTVSNACQACLQRGYDYYVQGECPNESSEESEVAEEEQESSTGLAITKCEQPDLSATNIACTLQYDPVCAYHDNDSNGKTAGNACQACLQQGYDYYTKGACEAGNEEEESSVIVEEEQESSTAQEQQSSSGLAEIRCEQPDLPATDIVCTEQYEPICAYKDNNPKQGTTAGNACQACMQQGFDYYTNGACEL